MRRGVRSRKAQSRGHCRVEVCRIMNLESDAEGQSRSVLGTLVREHRAGCAGGGRLVLPG